MITRLWLPEQVGGEPAWTPAIAAPEALRPVRITVATPLADLAPGTPWPQVGTAWFADADHLARFDAWAGPAGHDAVTADAVVVRGGPWLDHRWTDGGPRLQHLAVARRHPSLTREAFSARWRDHAGSVGGTPIPDAARGQAYVQHHVVDGAVDAITAVWFDSGADLRIRIGWMADALASTPPDDVFAERHLFAAEEEVVHPR